MPDDSQKFSGAEESVDLEVELAQPLGPEKEKALREAFEKTDARTFASLDIATEKISVSFDPTRTSKDELLRIVTQSGGKLARIEEEGSPLLSGFAAVPIKRRLVRATMRVTVYRSNDRLTKITPDGRVG